MKNRKRKKFTFRERAQYQFDNIMSRGTVALVGILFTITVVVVMIAGIFTVLFDAADGATVGESIWVSLMHAIDAGTLTADSGSFAFMLLMTLVTICGLFITSVLIGIVNTGMEGKMNALRKGKSRVLEENHLIILGYNRNLLILLREYIKANENQKKGVVVVMDNKVEKEVMEDTIRQRLPDTGNVRIICRCGDISDLEDLRVCSPEYARSIIINSEDDFNTIKAILAVTTLLKKCGSKDVYVTAVIQEQENYEAARMAGENLAEILFFDDTIARIVAQTSRQPGLSSVYTELFGYDGDEIYLEEQPKSVGCTMEELNLLYPVSTVLGIEKQGVVYLNPAGELTVEAGDRLVLLAEDDGVSHPAAVPAPVEWDFIRQMPENTPERRRKMLILGYGPRMAKVLAEEDKYMAPGSEILVAVQEEYTELVQPMIAPAYENIRVYLQVGNIYHKTVMKKLLDWEPDSVLVPNSLQEDAREDDNKTLLLLLQLRTLSRHMEHRPVVTSEMRDVENQELAQIAEVRDFVISSNITSLMVSQIAQSRALSGIFDELLSERGTEIYMRLASDYVELGQPITMYTACAAAAVKHQVFLGYRHTNPETDFLEVCINPAKESTMTYGPHDRFIVLADD